MGHPHQLAELLRQIDELEVSENFYEAHMKKFKVPFEPNNQEFWQIHYNV